MIMASEFAGYVKGGKPVPEERLGVPERSPTGRTYRIVTPSKVGARGLSLDLVVIDEALAHEAWLFEAIAPTQAQRDGARNSFGAQLMIISNAGDENSELLNIQRELGRRAVAEGDRARVWLEWSCADDDDPLDPAVWARTIPTLDQPDGISSAFLARQAETMGTDAFAREYLCRTVWSKSRQVITADVWADLPHVDLGRGRGGPGGRGGHRTRPARRWSPPRAMGDGVAVRGPRAAARCGLGRRTTSPSWPSCDRPGDRRPLRAGVDPDPGAGAWSCGSTSGRVVA